MAVKKPICTGDEAPNDLTICGSQNTVPKLQHTNKKQTTVAMMTRWSRKPCLKPVTPDAIFDSASRARASANDLRSLSASHLAWTS